MQQLSPLEQRFKARRARLFLIDETMVQVKGSEAWIWVCYEPFQKEAVSRTVVLLD
ncbi:MAG: hypothetical protein M1503_02090 [Thaumarchaeota archaeon]|nr:hypothetical protein [Nitrososphaerota archaeon]MCL5317042.1 hypothetical protein [Nitrososphaerota archaeon]